MTWAGQNALRMADMVPTLNLSNYQAAVSVITMAIVMSVIIDSDPC
jgi:uncharacterized protein (DUF1684 family)